jgi:hypothetical protein
MATDEQTLESLQKINDALRVLAEEYKTFNRHLAQQKRQIAWNKDGKYKPYPKN